MRTTGIVLGLVVWIGVVVWPSTPVFATAITCGTSCNATVTIGTQVFQVPVTVNANGVGTVSEFTVVGPGGSTASINSLTLNPNPFIVFAVAGTNNTDNPLAFSFAFNDPIALSGSIIAASSIGYTLTDGFIASQGTDGAVGVSIAPFNTPNIFVANDFTAALAETNKGVDVGPLASGGAGTCGPFIGATSNCGPYAATNPSLSGGPFTIMAATVSFVLTPHDAAALSGSVSQNPAAVPEPSTLLLLGSGLLGLAAWAEKSSVS